MMRLDGASTERITGYKSKDHAVPKKVLDKNPTGIIGSDF